MSVTQKLVPFDEEQQYSSRLLRLNFSAFSHLYVSTSAALRISFPA